MYSKPSEPRTIGGVLDDAITLYRASFRSVWPLAFLAEIPLAAQRAYIDFATAGIGPNNPQAVIEIFMRPAVWLSYLLIVLVVATAHTAVLASVDSIARAAPIGRGESLYTALRLFPRVFGMAVLFLIAVVVGSILLVVPGIFLGGSLLLAIAAIVVDDEGVFGSLATSSRLTWGHWWRTTTIYSVILLLAIVVGGVAGGIVGGIFGAIFGARSLQSIAATEFIAFTFGVLVMSLTPSALLSIYYDLKLRREGTDLAERVRALPTR